MAKHSKYQQRIIKDYYKNRGAIAVQRLQEQVTELYLAEGKKRERVWKTIVSNLEALEVPPKQIEHLQQQDDPALVAQLLERLMAKS